MNSVYSRQLFLKTIKNTIFFTWLPFLRHSDSKIFVSKTVSKKWFILLYKIKIHFHMKLPWMEQKWKKGIPFSCKNHSNLREIPPIILKQLLQTKNWLDNSAMWVNFITFEFHYDRDWTVVFCTSSFSWM